MDYENYSVEDFASDHDFIQWVKNPNALTNLFWKQWLEQHPDKRAIVEEAKVHFRHTKQMDWFLPGVPPTNKWIDVELVIVIEFRDGKMATERIYWDQAAVLRQIDKL